MYLVILVLLFVYCKSIDALQINSKPKKILGSLRAATSSGGFPSIAVVGFSGGVAEVIAYKFSSRGYRVSVILDDEPISPMVKNSVDYFSGDVEKQVADGKGKLHSAASVMQGKIVVVAGDLVPDEGEKIDELVGGLFSKLAKVLPTSVMALICASSATAEDEGNAISKLFGNSGSSSVFKKFADSNSVPLSIVNFGKLTGGIPGAEPVPFVSMPLLEPEVHPSYVLRSVVLSTANNKFSSIEPCTRDSLGETIARLVDQKAYLSGFKAQVVSIAGNPPVEKDWTNMFTRASTGSNVELLHIDFQEIMKPQALTNWLADSWFPQALIDADAATILTGARPVKAKKMPNGNVMIIWEDLQKDLTVRRVGEVEIRVLVSGGQSGPALSAVRLTTEILPGESLLMEKLLEGVNKQVYKKQLCIPIK